MRSHAPSIRKIFGLADARSPVFFSSLDEVNRHAGEIPYTHIIRRAWDELVLDAVYCVRGRIPTVFFKVVQSFDDQKLRELHRRFWSQGVATLLVVVGPGEVRVYSGMAAPARQDEEMDGAERLVDTLSLTADVLELRRFLKRVEAGAIYEEKPKSFRQDQVVDQYLLNNLTAARTLLIEKIDGKKVEDADKEHIRLVHAFLGRILFTRYLTDRKIVNGSTFSDVGGQGVSNLQELLLLPESKAHKALFALFAKLQKTFNGSMFDESIDKERDLIKPGHLPVLRDFLNGEQVGSAQMSLFFWDYDFSVIPVETFSAIYEDFLKAEDAADKQAEGAADQKAEDTKGKRRSGAYYTPKLLAEMVVDIATENMTGLLGERCLDPSCGSGIFLVILFNRMAEEWRRKNPNVRNLTRTNALIEILQSSLRGVDKSETACRIACFSLYLALLDQLNPRDIEELAKQRAKKGLKVLPPLLALQRKNYRTSDTPVVLEGDFFAPDLPLQKDFDLVVGNPPWVSRGGEKSSREAVEWCLNPEENPYLEVVTGTENERGVLERTFVPLGQIAHAFMWKVPTHLSENGRACLLLTSKVLFNDTDDFQNLWFSSVSVEEMLQLADWRRALFSGAICPSTLIRFNGKTPAENHQIDYAAPKVSRLDSRRGVIPVASQDQIQLAVADIKSAARSNEAPFFWKKLLWATPRDERLLERLMELPRLKDIAGEPTEGKRWAKGQGVQPRCKATKKPMSAWWDETWKFVNAKSALIDMFLLQSDCESIADRFRPCHRNRKDRQQIFSPPFVLVSQGFTKCALVSFPAIFRHTLQSISGPKDDEDLLWFLVAVLTSKLAQYILFHRAANWGTERTKVHFDELLEIPFPLPESHDDRAKAEEIVKRVSARFRDAKSRCEESDFGRENEIAQAKKDVESLVYDYYEITQRDLFLIEDTLNIIRPSITPTNLNSRSIKTLQPTNRKQRKAYADTLCEVLNGWMRRSPKRVSAQILLSDPLKLAVLTLNLGPKRLICSQEDAPEKLEAELKRLKDLLPERKGVLQFERSLSIFEEDKLHIVKPLELRHWMRSTALNDADAVASHLLMSGRNA